MSEIIGIRRRLLLLILVGLLFQLTVVIGFYVNMCPNLNRLMPDDAFYYLKIAENISKGNGSVFSPGETTNGYHPLWMGVLSVSHLILSPSRDGFILVSLLLSAIINALSALILFRLLRRWGFNANTAISGSALYMFLPWNVLMTLSGLETPLFFLCLFLLFEVFDIIMVSDKSRISHYILLGLAAAFLNLTRTDSVLITVPVFVMILLRKCNIREFAFLLISGATVTLLMFPWLYWSYVKFGSIMQTSGNSISIYRWWSMPSVLSVQFWILNTGRLFHKLAFFFFFPFLYHRSEYGFSFVFDVIMLLAVIATIIYLILHKRKNLKCIIFPMEAWLPALLILFFYTFISIHSQPWHLAVYCFLLIILLLNLLGRVLFRKSGAFLVTFICLALNAYTLGNGYYYQQQVLDMLGYGLSIGSDSEETIKIGAADCGYLGYFSRHIVVNLDGVVNKSVYDHIAAGTFAQYLLEQDFDIIAPIDSHRLEYYNRNMPE